MKNHGVLLEDLLQEGAPLEKTLLEGLLQEPILQEDIFRRAGEIIRLSYISDDHNHRDFSPEMGLDFSPENGS